MRLPVGALKNNISVERSLTLTKQCQKMIIWKVVRKCPAKVLAIIPQIALSAVIKLILRMSF